MQAAFFTWAKSVLKNLFEIKFQKTNKIETKKVLISMLFNKKRDKAIATILKKKE